MERDSTTITRDVRFWIVLLMFFFFLLLLLVSAPAV